MQTLTYNTMRNYKTFILNKKVWLVSFFMNVFVALYIINLENRPYGALSEFVNLLFYYPFIVVAISFVFTNLYEKQMFSFLGSIYLAGYSLYDMISSPEFPDFRFDLSEIGIILYLIFTPLVLSAISYFIIKMYLKWSSRS